uniref:Ribonucleoside-diphosphate reductase large subunit n=1 Tax=Tanacetum cinerariifolium TaxID=118510 RepID=A0A6L2K800_TANCI|nr:ribonucleoside-diphosphate reductase large subunit [Tanacetum cinerariifolium]
MFKLDLEPLAYRLLQNREIHLEYLKNTQQQADILRGIVKQAKSKQPLDNALDFVCMHAQRIRELLVYVQDTFPNVIKPRAKKVVVTPKNNVKKVRFAEPLTSSSNIKQVESYKTSDSNTPVLSPTELKYSTSNCRSNPLGNKKNNRISQTPSRNMKNKVEAQPKNVNKKNRVVKPICNVDVKHSLLNANYEPIYATCKKSMFDCVHDMCLLDFMKNANSHAKSAKKHKNKLFGNLRVMKISEPKICFMLYGYLTFSWKESRVMASGLCFETCNRKSNHQNPGSIKSLNLRTMIIEYTSPTETGVCNLASIALPRYVREKVQLEYYLLLQSELGFISIGVFTHDLWDFLGDVLSLNSLV